MTSTLDETQTTPAPTPDSATAAISPETLAAWLADGAELAVLDVRDREVVGYASPLFATNLPADEVPEALDRFIPRRVVRTVLVDDDNGDAARLVSVLRTQGWSNLVHLDGGINAWTAHTAATTPEGEPVPTFDTPGLDFVLAVRDERDTPITTAVELAAARERGEDVVVIDTRTLPEYEIGHVPGAVSIPGAELLLRFSDLVPDPSTRVVVSCAGLPRAVLGAQTLIDAGVPNKVSYLHDGTRAWKEQGWELESGAVSTYRDAGANEREAVPGRVESISSADEFPRIDIATASTWAADPTRTTYLLDVRTPEEFEAGHIEGSISSEGGQLLGVAYRTIAVRGSRVVLIDDLLGARAAVVAHWLQRRGYEIAVLLTDFS